MEPVDELEKRDAYNSILRGIIALIVFSIIVLTPHIVTFVGTTTTDYDDDSTYADGLDQDENPSSCAVGEDYDGEKCFEELKSAAIILNLIQILKYSIPIYGLIEVYRGVNRISDLTTKSGIESRLAHQKELDNAKNAIDLANTEDVEELEELNEPKSSIPRELIDFVVIIILTMAIAYLLSTF
tara:strand:+ start:204 stop:755 length:552 start_codon:yes stop_codon:yes gene_type:complete